MSDAAAIPKAVDIQARRAHLTIQAAPGDNRDYIATLSGNLVGTSFGLTSVGVEVRYVPDRFVTRLGDFQTYLAYLDKFGFEHLETVGAILRDDFANVLIGKWTQVTITGTAPGRIGLMEHVVVMEDRRPKWNNKTLMDRVKLY